MTSYLMGHVSGLNEVFEEYAKEAWVLMQENSWLLPRFEEQYAELAEMMRTFEQWKGLEAFDPLKRNSAESVQRLRYPDAPAAERHHALLD